MTVTARTPPSPLTFVNERFATGGKLGAGLWAAGDGPGVGELYAGGAHQGARSNEICKSGIQVTPLREC